MSEKILYVGNEKVADIAPGMIGLFFEDINYACDGGISAQMIENGSFEFVEAFGFNDHYTTKNDGTYGWAPYPTSGDGASMVIKRKAPVNKVNPHFMSFTASESQRGIMNKAYDGVCMKKGKEYVVSAYLRSMDYNGPVYVYIYEGKVRNARPLVKEVLCNSVTSEWKKCEVKLVAEENIRHGKFVISMGELADDDTAETLAGHFSDEEMPVSRNNCKTGATLHIDFVSMKPGDALFGVFRRDLIEMLKDLNPGFLRFPGGCIVEGNELSNRYRWKETVGPRETRRWNWNRWAVHGNGENEFCVSKFSHYNQSYDIGYYEYFLLCEYIGAKPLPVQNVGLACQYQTHQQVEPGTKEFDMFVQDILDLIEFANGDEHSRWGSLRAKMGHKDSFGLEMLGIGNEQWETDHSKFFERYTLIEKAVHEKYPDIKLIGSAGPGVQDDHYAAAWEFYHRAAQEKGANFVYAVDEHYYRKPEWFLENNHFYDDYPRDVKVFAGEYAAHIEENTSPTKKNTLGAALSEAAFLTGVVKNADVVTLASYAPLFARIGYTQWWPDLIWFDDEGAYASPSYYVQKMFSRHMGDFTLASSLDSKNVYHVVTFDKEKKEYIIKLVNNKKKDFELKLELPEGDMISRMEVCTLACADGKGENAFNSMEKPCSVAPVKQIYEAYSGTVTVPAKSFSVIRLKKDI